MKCNKIMKLLAADYLDEELDQNSRSEVIQHLEACPRCREFEAEIRRAAVEPLRTAMAVSAPPGLHAKVMRRIRQEQVSDEAKNSWVNWRSLVHTPRTIYATALATVMLITAFIVYHPFPNREGGSLSGETDMLYDYLLEQSSAFSNGNSDGGESSGKNISDYGTLVEEFLM